MNGFLFECRLRGLDVKSIEDYSSTRNPTVAAIDWSQVETEVLQAFVQILQQLIPGL